MRLQRVKNHYTNITPEKQPKAKVSHKLKDQAKCKVIIKHNGFVFLDNFTLMKTNVGYFIPH